MLDQYVHKIEAVTRQARSETALQIKLETLLREILALYVIAFEPSVNETLKSQGLSQVDSTRPDSLFGHVVLDYKSPRLLSAVSELAKAKKQIEDYLNSVTGGDHLIEAQKWAGILWDGASIVFCHSNGRTWLWTELFPISESSLLTLVGNYRALQRKPLTASMLAYSFGKDSDAARTVVTTMCSHLSKAATPHHYVVPLSGKALFEQVSVLMNGPTTDGSNLWAKSLRDRY